ncbi:MAGE domain-containing protein [Sporobolomyces salmoneus]|uniref:MAGE domain-containing protein n=1 Tax=Sporobolomyces salmoneus TaxID=183962 RepID=UPI00317017EC
MARPAKKQRAAASSADEEEEEATDYSSDGAASNKKNKSKKKSANASQKKKGRGRPKKKKNTGDDSDEEMDEDSDEDEDEEGAGGKGKKVELNDTEKKEHMQAIVRYVLFNETHRRVLKREDIVKNVLTDGRGRHFNSLMPKVQKLLKDVLGMELILLRPRETATGKNPPKAWMLRSALPQALLRHSATATSSNYSTEIPFADFDKSTPMTTSDGRKTLKQELGEWLIDEEALPSRKKGTNSDEEEESDEEDEEEEEEGGVMRDAKREEGASYGVLGTILALILVNGRVLGDDQLISYLRRLSLTPGSLLPLSLSSPHPSSLTLSTYLNTLVKQQYLERSKTAAAATGTQTQTQGRSQAAPSRTQRSTAEGGVQESGDPSIEWRWGARAESELGEEGVARFVEFIFENGKTTGASNGEEGGEGQGRKRGKTGEKFLKEVARAAGVKELQRAEEIEGGGFN